MVAHKQNEQQCTCNRSRVEAVVDCVEQLRNSFYIFRMYTVIVLLSVEFCALSRHKSLFDGEIFSRNLDVLNSIRFTMGKKPKLSWHCSTIFLELVRRMRIKCELQRT